MRTCIRCREEKDESEFNIRNFEKGYLQSVCKSCQQEQGKERYQNNTDNVKAINRASRLRLIELGKKLLFEYLSNKACVDCGEADIEVLTFDHVRGDKRMNISDMVMQGYGVDSIRRELEKTEVLCFNCHMKREHKKRGAGRFAFFDEKET